MNLAILGTRGIPARYGGFETFAEELAKRLTQRGHKVTVYCRRRYSTPTYHGISLCYLPTIRHKYLDTIVHTFVSTLHLLFHGQDVALYCNAANALFTLLPRLRGIPTVLNVDGLERKRKKWNRLAKAWYLVSEWLATFCPTAVVTDARTITEYYLRRYHKPTHFIPYGAVPGKLETTQTLKRLGLKPGEYFLYVSRMEPENNALMVREAFERLSSPVKLVLVGDAPYAQDYIQRVRATRDPRVIFPGAIYGRGYHELLSHCLAYIHATEVGGTHPALIEAMGRGALVLFLNTLENSEVAAGAGVPFGQDLFEKLQSVLSMPEDERAAWRQRSMQRVQSRYTWESVTDAYEQLFLQISCAR
jgi:glycosyltransferase involved in cell wall biosynthesis